MIAGAQAAAASLPPETVLAGLSLGAQVAGEVWATRPETAGVLLLHGPCEIPIDARAGLPVQAHLAEPEPFDDEGFLADWAEGARRAGVAFELFRYPGAGHYFTDASLPDHDASAARLATERRSASSPGSDRAKVAKLGWESRRSARRAAATGKVSGRRRGARDG